MAQPVLEQVFLERAETLVSVSEGEHLQSLRNMRDQTRALANDLSSVRVQMAADVERSGVELRDFSIKKVLKQIVRGSGGKHQKDISINFLEVIIITSVQLHHPVYT